MYLWKCALSPVGTQLNSLLVSAQQTEKKKELSSCGGGPHLHIFFLSTRPTRRKRPHLHIMDVVIRVNRGVPLIDDGPIRGFQ